MRKFVFRSFVLLLCFACSCTKDGRIYEESAAERTSNELERYRSVILARQRWVMEYFPDEQLRYGGWVYVLEFHENNTLTAWFEGSAFVPQENPVTQSQWRIELGTGPMLKFCTNNDYLHFFSFPGGENGGGYRGWGGDYEFSFMKMNDACDEIILRGSRNGNSVRLVPLPGDVEPEEYVELVRDSQRDASHWTSLELCVSGEVVGSVTRAQTPVFDDFTKYYQSKVWTLCYTRPDGESSIQSLCTLSLPGGVVLLYKPCTLTLEDSEGNVREESFSCLRWIKHSSLSADLYTSTDSFLQIEFK